MLVAALINSLEIETRYLPIAEGSIGVEALANPSEKEVREEVPELRLATLADLDLILPVHARMAFDESGIDPLQKDSLGFRKRCVRRIEQGRTWVWIQDGKLMFKAELVSDTPAVIYLEGVWVSPEERHQGYGLRCMSQLARILLPCT